VVAETQFLYLTTTGRRTGLPREIEIWHALLDGRYYLISELRERADWVRNILAEPRVRFRVGRDGESIVGRARVVRDADEPALATAVAALFDARYGWSDGLIVELTAAETGPVGRHDQERRPS
jgi:deazaflavin-dependent oxidoreductase (nitroreductase family)